MHLLYLVLLAASGLLFFPRELTAASPTPSGFGILYSVNTTSDTVIIGACQNGLAGCSLRGAIQAANIQPNGTDGISLDLPAGSVINLTQALPDITDDVAIFGAGPNQVTVRRNTAPNYRIFNVTTSATVSFSDLTISNGAADSGGGINHGGGTLHLINCVFLGNLAQNGGGVNNNGGTLNVTSCTFTGNGAGSNGGGIANNFFGTVNVINSTFSGNSATNGDPNADGGGGICNGSTTLSNGGILKVTNSTFTGNFAFSGGAISTVAGGTAAVTNSTLSGNTVGFSNKGGGISSDSTGPVNVKSCIIALSTNGPSGLVRRDVSGIFASSGFNLIGAGDGSTGFTQPTDQVGTIAAPLNPQLDPSGLQNNGGPIQTIALLLGSPAVDKGASNGLTGTLATDQRGTGFPRRLDYPNVTNAVGGDGTDIGASEFGGTLVPICGSRKLHGAGVLDIDLPLTGNTGIECRSGGGANNHQAIMSFPGGVTVASASVSAGTGSVSNLTVNGSQVTVDLTGVANAQTIVLTLSGVSNGESMSNVSVPMGVLLGDTNADRFVNSGDALQTRSRAGQAANAANFRSDVNVDGVINSGDTTVVRGRAGTTLP